MMSNKDVLEELGNWAEESDNIRAVLLTGSRADPSLRTDSLSDYDVEVYARNKTTFMDDDSWISRFGCIMVRWPLSPSTTTDGQWVTQLVQFQDGSRIDFQITDVDPDASRIAKNAPRVLIDKEGILRALHDEECRGIEIVLPDAEAFASRINAFWWDIVYVAKALCRKELNYAKYMLEGNIRFMKLQPLIE